MAKIIIMILLINVEITIIEHDYSLTLEAPLVFPLRLVFSAAVLLCSRDAGPSVIFCNTIFLYVVLYDNNILTYILSYLLIRNSK